MLSTSVNRGQKKKVPRHPRSILGQKAGDKTLPFPTLFPQQRGLASPPGTAQSLRRLRTRSSTSSSAGTAITLLPSKRRGATLLLPSSLILQFAFCLLLLFAPHHEALVQQPRWQNKRYIRLQPGTPGSNSTPGLTSLLSVRNVHIILLQLLVI